MRVIVIGSGIAGLSTAIALRKVGIEASVYERAPELREIGAGISLWANAIRALDHLGVGQAVRKRSLSLGRSELRARDGRKIQISFDAKMLEQKIGMSPFVAMIHRAELVDALAEFLPEGTAKYGFECVGVEHENDRTTVRFANGYSDTADAVIGADGIKSAVRAAIFGPEKPRYSGYTCWRGVSPRPSEIEPGYIGEWWGRGRRFGITTLTQDRTYWFAVHNAYQGQPYEDERKTISDLFHGWADPVPEILATTSTNQIVRNDIIDRPPTKIWSVGRVCLIGDAAHPTTPNLGQGGCMAIEDSVALARAMMLNPQLPAAFAAFTKERYARTAEITNQSWQFGKIAQLQGPVACWLRDALGGLILPIIGTRNVTKYASFDIGPLPKVSS